MRYALRNKNKITVAYSESILKRIISSLDNYFNSNKEVPATDMEVTSGDRYPTLIINDVEHSLNMIAFYILEVKFGVYRLAFKEFIG